MKKFIYGLVFSFALISFLILMSYLFIFPIYQKEEEIVLPDILNHSYEQAAEELDLLHLKYEINFVDSTSQQNNKIVRTMPNVLNNVKKNSKIILFVGKSNQVEFMKKYVHNTFDQVEEEIKDLENRLNLQVIKIYEKNDLYPNHTILDQFPKENQIIQKDSVIVFYLSSYEGKMYLPNFTNWNLNLLLNYQKDNQINFEFVYEFSATVEKDKVIRQSILPNTVWYKNKSEKIVIYLSKGKNNEEIPNLEGLEVTSAIYILNFLKIEYKLEYVYSNQIKNTVIEQIYEAGLGYDQIIVLKVAK